MDPGDPIMYQKIVMTLVLDLSDFPNEGGSKQPETFSLEIRLPQWVWHGRVVVRRTLRANLECMDVSAYSGDYILASPPDVNSPITTE